MVTNITPYGVCYDLPHSPYTVRYKNWCFHFSTQRNAKNFEDKVAIREEWLTDSLTRRFHYVLDADELAAFQLYDQIEKRGFYAINLHDCQELTTSNRPNFIIVAR